MYLGALREWEMTRGFECYLTVDRARRPVDRPRRRGGQPVPQARRHGPRREHHRLRLRPPHHVPVRDPGPQGDGVPGPKHHLDPGAVHEVRRRQVRPLLHRLGLRLRRRPGLHATSRSSGWERRSDARPPGRPAPTRSRVGSAWWASATPTSATTAFGVRLAEAVRAVGVPRRDRGRADARALGGASSRRGEFQTVLFLDAVEMGAAPGDVVLLDAREIAARFPQVSTHKLSLGTLARLIEADGGATRSCLLGVQPQSVGPGRRPVGRRCGRRWRSCATSLVEVLPAGTQPLAVCGERP